MRKRFCSSYEEQGNAREILGDTGFWALYRYSCLDRQLDALTAYSVDKICQEKMPGTKKNRPKLDRMLNTLQSGDTVVCRFGNL